ncbi:hypothetical protein T11_4326 [Trichinella zimbabwensis]|uniref:Uncharacterized protein n=1 Tax=Trichinella zimbabwensis TaxID=268475 RepID=A0A0V1HYH9_9BILA|nr:hypothetical protein T11_4326 [Trichinella zimbabwensis]
MDLITELKLNRIKFALLRNDKKNIALNVYALYTLFSRAIFCKESLKLRFKHGKTIVIGRCTGNDHAFVHWGQLFSRFTSFAFTPVISSGDEIPLN